MLSIYLENSKNTFLQPLEEKGAERQELTAKKLANIAERTAILVLFGGFFVSLPLVMFPSFLSKEMLYLTYISGVIHTISVTHFNILNLDTFHTPIWTMKELLLKDLVNLGFLLLAPSAKFIFTLFDNGFSSDINRLKILTDEQKLNGNEYKNLDRSIILLKYSLIQDWRIKQNDRDNLQRLIIASERKGEKEENEEEFLWKKLPSELQIEIAKYLL